MIKLFLVISLYVAGFNLYGISPYRINFYFLKMNDDKDSNDNLIEVSMSFQLQAMGSDETFTQSMIKQNYISLSSNCNFYQRNLNTKQLKIEDLFNDEKLIGQYKTAFISKNRNLKKITLNLKAIQSLKEQSIENQNFAFYNNLEDLFNLCFNDTKYFMSCEVQDELNLSIKIKKQPDIDEITQIYQNSQKSKATQLNDFSKIINQALLKVIDNKPDLSQFSDQIVKKENPQKSTTKISNNIQSDDLKMESEIERLELEIKKKSNNDEINTQQNTIVNSQKKKKEETKESSKKINKNDQKIEEKKDPIEKGLLELIKQETDPKLNHLKEIVSQKKLSSDEDIKLI